MVLSDTSGTGSAEGGAVSVWVGKVGYLVVLGEYNLVLLNIKCYLVSKWLSCLYTLKEVET